jgi:CubicO group peptidase (beta-lactamase class C family)
MEHSMNINSTTRLVIALSAALCLNAGPVLAQDQVFTDPGGLFRAPIPTNWTATPANGYVLLSEPERQIKLYLLALPATDTAEAIAAAWKLVNPDFNEKIAQSQKPPSRPGVEETVVVVYNTPQQRVVQAVGQKKGDQVYVLLFDGPLEAVIKRSAQVNIIQSGFEITSVVKTDLSQAKAKVFDAAMANELSAYSQAILKLSEVPGMAVAVVQNGKMVYARGFGVKELGKPERLTVNTQMMIGSTGKSITTAMMAGLVDDGVMDWNTPAKQILPSFAVKDPELSVAITMQNLVCACSGVPRRDIELVFHANEQTASDTVKSLAQFNFFTKFGEAFQYSNQMVGSGGYIAAYAASNNPDLAAGYADTLSKRLLQPSGMMNTTVDVAAVLARNEYATPHGATALVGYRPLALATEQILAPVAPAGAHWSTVLDMARYLGLQMNQGVAYTGKRVVSAKNLTRTWTPQVPVSSESSYGLGWFVDNYNGQPLLHHGGNTFGFTADLAFLPQAGLGIVVLSNGQSSNPFNEAIRTKLFDLAFGQDSKVDEGLAFLLEQGKMSVEQAKSRFQPLDVAAVTAFIGDFTDPVLGSLRLSLENAKLYADFGEAKSELRPQRGDDGKLRYLMMEPPLAGAPFELVVQDGTPVVVLDVATDVYRFVRR